MDELFIAGDPRFLAGALGGGRFASDYEGRPVTIGPRDRTVGLAEATAPGAGTGPLAERLARMNMAVHTGKRPYHHRPELNVFLRRGECPSAGVELETEERLGVDLRVMERELSSNWFHFESDGSLAGAGRCGYELITEPLPPSIYRRPELWTGLQNALAPWVESWAFAQTGLHVHVGTDQFESMDAELPFLGAPGDRRMFGKALVAYLYYVVVDRSFSDRVFLRKPGRYCASPQLPRGFGGKPAATAGDAARAALEAALAAASAVSGDESAASVISTVRRGGRSVCEMLHAVPRGLEGHGTEVNAGNAMTVEFRRGKGTLNGVSILRMVEFATLLVKWAGDLLKDPALPVGHREFMEYVSGNTTSAALRAMADAELGKDGKKACA